MYLPPCPSDNTEDTPSVGCKLANAVSKVSAVAEWWPRSFFWLVSWQLFLLQHLYTAKVILLLTDNHIYWLCNHFSQRTQHVSSVNYNEGLATEWNQCPSPAFWALDWSAVGEALATTICSALTTLSSPFLNTHKKRGGDAYYCNVGVMHGALHMVKPGAAHPNVLWFHESWSTMRQITQSSRLNSIFSTVHCANLDCKRCFTIHSHILFILHLGSAT